MSAHNENEQNLLAQKYQELKQRLEDDPEFRAQVEDDPITALTEAGLREGTIGPFLRAVGIEAEVTGYNFFPVGGTSSEKLITPFSDPDPSGGGLPA
jgi:hypothetical protein